MNFYESMKGMFIPENHSLVIIKREINYVINFMHKMGLADLCIDLI